MTNLYAFAQSNGIAVLHDNIPTPRLKALYCEDEAGGATIILDHSLSSSAVRERCVLAEEIGHYYTAQGTALTKAIKTERDRSQIRRNEHRAARWAATKLIPLGKFLDALISGIEQPHELAEHFGVTEEYIRMRYRVWEITGR